MDQVIILSTNFILNNNYSTANDLQSLFVNNSDKARNYSIQTHTMITDYHISKHTDHVLLSAAMIDFIIDKFTINI